MRYRRDRGSYTWHWHKDCSKWPSPNFVEMQSKPIAGRFCNECKQKDREKRRPK